MIYFRWEFFLKEKSDSETIIDQWTAQTTSKMECNDFDLLTF